MRDFFRRLGRSYEELLTCLVPITGQLAFSLFTAFALTHMALLILGVFVVSLGFVDSVEIHQAVMVAITVAVTLAMFRWCLESWRTWESRDSYSLLAKLFLALSFSSSTTHLTLWLGRATFGNYGVTKLTALGLVVLVGLPLAYYSLFLASKQR